MRITRSHDLSHKFVMLSYNSLMLLHHFILMEKFVFVILIVFPSILIYFLEYFFQSHHLTVDWLKIKFFIFFFYTVILVSWLWNDNPDCDRSFSLIFFSTRIFFNFIIQHWVYWIFNLFYCALYKDNLASRLASQISNITQIDSRHYFTFYVKLDPYFF
jgi:hypothetical protein